MKKKIFFKLLLIVAVVFSASIFNTAKAVKEPSPGITFCNYWCTTGGDQCVLHVGYSGGTYDVICHGWFW